ncbi:MAG: hypothetical protein R6V20_02215 [Desulfobia sp.]
MLVNIYLHYALDLWFEKIVKPLCYGDVMLMRFADDCVCCFQYREEERRVSRVLGKPLVKMRTAREKFQLALAALTSWIKKERGRLGTAALLIKFGQKLQGHFNYYGVSDNFEMLKRFYRQSCRTVFKWLNRRTQKKSCNWAGFSEMLVHFKVPRSKIIGYWE